MSRLFFGSLVDLLHETILNYLSYTEIISWLLCLPLTEDEMDVEFAEYERQIIIGSKYDMCKDVIHKTDKEVAKDNDSDEKSLKTDNNASAITHYRAEGPDNKPVPLKFQRKFRMDRRKSVAQKWNGFLKRNVPNHMVLADMLFKTRMLVEGDYHLSAANRELLLKEIPTVRSLSELKTVYQQLPVLLTDLLYVAVPVNIAAEYKRRTCYNNLNKEGTFIGRNDELSDLSDCFAGNNHLAVLHGIDGVGKTALALRFAWQKTLSCDVVWWIDGSNEQNILNAYSDFLARLTTMDAILGKRQKHMTKNMVSGAADPLDSFKNYMENCPLSWLLVYDDCALDTEEERKMLRRVLPAGCNGKVLITTHSDHEFGDAIRMPVSVMNEKDAADMMKIVSEAKDTQQILTLVDSLGRFPLAIELAGERIRLTPEYDIDTYLYRLEREGLKFLEEGFTEAEKKRTITSALKTLFAKIEEDRQHDDVSCCVRALILCCSFGAPYDIALRTFSWLETSKQQELEKAVPELYKQIHALALLCKDTLKREDLSRLVIKYGLLQAQDNGLLSMNPFMQRVMLTSIDSNALRLLGRQLESMYTYADEEYELEAIEKRKSFLNSLNFVAAMPEAYTSNTHIGYIASRYKELARIEGQPCWKTLQYLLEKEDRTIYDLLERIKNSSRSEMRETIRVSPQKALLDELRIYNCTINEMMDSLPLKLGDNTFGAEEHAPISDLVSWFKRYAIASGFCIPVFLEKWEKLLAIDAVVMLINTLEYLCSDFFEFMAVEEKEEIWRIIRLDHKVIGSVIENSIDFLVGDALSEALVEYSEILKLFASLEYADAARMADGFDHVIELWRKYQRRDNLIPVTVTPSEYARIVSHRNMEEQWIKGRGQQVVKYKTHSVKWQFSIVREIRKSRIAHKKRLLERAKERGSAKRLQRHLRRLFNDANTPK